MSKILFCTHLLHISIIVNSEYGFVAWDKYDILVCNNICGVLGVYINCQHDNCGHKQRMSSHAWATLLSAGHALDSSDHYTDHE